MAQGWEARGSEVQRSFSATEPIERQPWKERDKEGRRKGKERKRGEVRTEREEGERKDGR